MRGGRLRLPLRLRPRHGLIGFLRPALQPENNSSSHEQQAQRQPETKTRTHKLLSPFLRGDDLLVQSPLECSFSQMAHFQIHKAYSKGGNTSKLSTTVRN